MKRWGRYSAIAICLLAVFALGGIRGQAQGQGYHQVMVIKIPGVPPARGNFTFDISWVDPGTHRYYLADRTNNGIDVIDTQANRYLFTMAQGRFRGFSGKPDTSGPDGVLVIGNEAWVGDASSQVRVIDIRSGLIVATVVTGGKGGNRADELAYDPRDHLVLIANDADDPPFLTFISTASRKVVGKIMYPNATNGLEQPVWDPASGMFYQNVPATKQNPGGEVSRIDPRTMKVVAIYAVKDCEPGGLALGPQHRLLLGCSGDAIDGGAHAQALIIDADSGTVLATITQVGGADEVWYDPGDHNYYLAASKMTSTGMKGGAATPVLGIIDANTNQWVANVPSSPVSHSVAADSSNNRVYLPVKDGIAVYSK